MEIELEVDYGDRIGGRLWRSNWRSTMEIELEVDYGDRSQAG